MQQPLLCPTCSVMGSLRFFVMLNMPGSVHSSCPGRMCSAALRAEPEGDHSRSHSSIRCQPRKPCRGGGGSEAVRNQI